MAVIKCRICGLFYDLDVSSQVCRSCRRNAKDRPPIKKDPLPSFGGEETEPPEVTILRRGICKWYGRHWYGCTSSASAG